MVAIGHCEHAAGTKLNSSHDLAEYLSLTMASCTASNANATF
jgi:hypothetical protein